MSFQQDRLCQQERAPCCAHPCLGCPGTLRGERKAGDHWFASSFQDATNQEGLAVSGGIRLVVYDVAIGHEVDKGLVSLKPKKRVFHLSS